MLWLQLRSLNRGLSFSRSCYVPFSTLLDSLVTGEQLTNWTKHHLAFLSDAHLLAWPTLVNTSLEAWQAHITQNAVPLAIKTKTKTGMSVCERSLQLYWRVKTIRHLYCPFPGWAWVHPVYWKEFNRGQLGPYRAWSHPKSLVMIALFDTDCLLHALSFSLKSGNIFAIPLWSVSRV